jgi:hypothetical protein
MVFCLPQSVLAADSGAAILHTKGGVWVNGTEARDATAILPGDLLQTKPGPVANLDADGSSVLIQSESLVKFNGNSVTLEHGSVSVGTSKSIGVHVDCMRIAPVSNEWTKYDVTDVSPAVQVAARQKDVSILFATSLRKPTPESTASQSATLHEGEQATRNASEACGALTKPGGATNMPKTKLIEIGAGAGGGVLILCLLLCSGKGHSNVSPSKP